MSNSSNKSLSNSNELPIQMAPSSDASSDGGLSNLSVMTDPIVFAGVDPTEVDFDNDDQVKDLIVEIFLGRHPQLGKMGSFQEEDTKGMSKMLRHLYVVHRKLEAWKDKKSEELRQKENSAAEAYWEEKNARDELQEAWNDGGLDFSNMDDQTMLLAMEMMGDGHLDVDGLSLSDNDDDEDKTDGKPAAK